MSNNPPPIGFLDANVLANAILADNRIMEIRQEGLLTSKSKDQVAKEEQIELKSYKPARDAYSLTALLRGPHDVGLHAVTSDLALHEVTSVLVEEYKAKQLWKMHVPFRYWQSAQKDIRLTKVDLADIQTGILKYAQSTRHVITRINDYGRSTADMLISQYNCDTRDAILVATALQAKSPIFVTEDDRLKRKLRKFGQIDVVKTETLVNQLKSMPKASFYVVGCQTNGNTQPHQT